MPERFTQGYALVIGVGADLPITIKDATAVANLLCDSSRCAYPVDQVKLLTGEDAKRSEVLSALEWLAHSANSEASVLVYFSGHGIEIPDYHLMTYGYDIKNLHGTTISSSTFTECLHAIRSKKLLVLLDCCHAGGQAEIKGWPKSPVSSSIIHELGSSSGRVLIASSRKDEKSWTGKSYSVFTSTLLDALSGHGSFEQDGFARVLDIAMWLGRKVPELTNDKQHPIIKVSNLKDNFAITWYAGGEKMPRSIGDKVELNPVVASAMNATFISSQHRMLSNYYENLLLIEERMSEYIEFTEIPLQLIKNKRQTESKIAEIEEKLGLRN